MDEQGLNDAAIFLMSLGEEEAAEVFKHLSPKEVQKLGETIARMRNVSRERLDEVINKFSGAAAQQSLLVSDTGNYVRAVLKRALGDDKASLLIDRILQGGDVSGIESLKWMDPLSVAELLRNEHPQIIAAILVHLDYDHAAGVLMQFGDRQRSEVLLRVATLEGIQPAALKDLNEVLFKVLSGGDKVRKSSLGGVKAAAEMINLLGNNTEGVVLENIRAHDPDLAQKIMDKMFVFDDVGNPGRGAQGRCTRVARKIPLQYVFARWRGVARRPGIARAYALVGSRGAAKGNLEDGAPPVRRRPDCSRRRR